MYRVLKKERLTPSAVLIEVEDERAKLVKPGQYALVQFKEDSEPIPLSFLHVKENSYTFLVEAVGRATLEITELLEEGFNFIEAPCGSPFPVKEYGRVLLVSKNWGIAPLINVGKALKEKNNEVYFIHVGENEEKVFLTEEASEISEEFLLFTEDGSLGEEGNTEWALRFFLENFPKPDLVVSAGSNIDSQMVCEVAKEKGLNHIAMVNAHILDANGLCLACRVLVEGEEKLACLDGPWFDGKKVNWDYAIQKEFFYRDEEKKALEAFMKELRRIKAKRGS
ncbi:hypothetical protein JCM9492_14260 [Aquifex pyrophilus]